MLPMNHETFFLATRVEKFVGFSVKIHYPYVIDFGEELTQEQVKEFSIRYEYP